MRINEPAHEIFCSGFIFVAESLLSRVTGNWQASKASETVLGVDNENSYSQLPTSLVKVGYKILGKV